MAKQRKGGNETGKAEQRYNTASVDNPATSVGSRQGNSQNAPHKRENNKL